MLINFDWPGEASKVRCPVTRSEGFHYPGRPGGPIDTKRDPQLYEKWKGER